MSDPVVSPSASPTRLDDDKTLPIVVYVLYLLGLFTGLTIFIGFIMAYALKGGVGELARSHYIFQIRTVWIALAWGLIGGVLLVFGLPLTLVLIGFVFLYVAWTIFGLIGAWFVVRCVVGLIYASRDEAYPRPQAWLI
jgi:uncharacterized membrane protein